MIDGDVFELDLIDPGEMSSIFMLYILWAGLQDLRIKMVGTLLQFEVYEPY